MFQNGGSQLTAHGLGVMAQEWEVSMGGAAGEQIHHTLALQSRKAPNQVAVAGLPCRQVSLKCRAEVICPVAKRRIGLG